MATTYLTRTFSAGNRKTGTISVWLKRNNLDATQNIFSTWNTSANGYISAIINIASSGRIGLFNYTADGTSTHTEFQSNARFRDVSGWYHIVFSWDTTLSTASDRYKLYVNGERITSFSVATYPTLNEDLYFDIGGSSNPVSIGSEHAGGGGGYFNGLMSHYHHTDGTAYDASYFGETDATTGEWKIKTDVSVTYGTNGFFILKDGNGITDQSGEGNDFTNPGGTITNTEDNPSNVFATMNSLANYHSAVGFAYGNTQISPTNNKGGATSTLAIPSNNGKIYVEAKMHEYIQDERFYFGIMPQEFKEANDPVNGSNKMIGLSGFVGNIYANGSSINSFYGQNFTSPANWEGTLAMAVDLTSATKTIAFSVNGAWITGTNATSTDFSNALKVDITSYLSLSNFWNIAFGNGNSTGHPGTIRMNFGNGYFGTTAVSSAGTNASGNGIFEYDVPTGYTALSTKGLNL